MRAKKIPRGYGVNLWARNLSLHLHLHLVGYIHVDVLVWYSNKLPTTMLACLLGEVFEVLSILCHVPNQSQECLDFIC